MDRLKDLLKKRAQALGVAKLEAMTKAKAVIKQSLKIEVRVLYYKNGILKIAAKDSSAASEIRLNKEGIINKINQKLPDEKLKDLIIVIR